MVCVSSFFSLTRVPLALRSAAAARARRAEPGHGRAAAGPPGRRAGPQAAGRRGQAAEEEEGTLGIHEETGQKDGFFSFHFVHTFMLFVFAEVPPLSM